MELAREILCAAGNDALEGASLGEALPTNIASRSSS